MRIWLVYLYYLHKEDEMFHELMVVRMIEWRDNEYYIAEDAVPFASLFDDLDTDKAFLLQVYRTINNKNGFPFLDLSIRWNGNRERSLLIIHNACNQSTCPIIDFVVHADAVHEYGETFGKAHNFSSDEMMYLRNGIELALSLIDQLL